jgi:hypothetical protein
MRVKALNVRIINNVLKKLFRKRGRKQLELQLNYFDVREEEAVKLFFFLKPNKKKKTTENEFLRHPLDKMISSIIRRYKLYRKDMDFREIHNDTHSFLMTRS